MINYDKLEIELNSSIGYVINRTAIKIKTYLFKGFKENGFNITPEQLTVLIGLRQKNGQYQKELGDKVLKDKPNMTRLLDILEKMKLITRKHDKQDRRKFKIFLTEEGNETIEKLLPIITATKKNLVRNLTEEEISNVINVLNKISFNIENVKS